MKSGYTVGSNTCGAWSSHWIQILTFTSSEPARRSDRQATVTESKTTSRLTTSLTNGTATVMNATCGKC